MRLTLNSDWLAHGLRVRVSAGGGAAQDMVVDTGSNGVVVSRRYLGSAYQELSPPQSFSGFTYSSSGNSYAGEWVRTQLTIGSVTGSGPTVQTGPLLVRAVDRMCDKAGTCNSDQSKLDVAMLGVGFDRAADRSAAPANSGPAINPFLNISAMVAGTMTKGYIVGSGSLILGPTRTDMSGFAAVALQKTSTGPPDWSAPTSCLSVSGSVPPQCGSLLLDTGLGYAIVQAPQGVQPPTVPAAIPGDRPTVAKGQQVSITVPAVGDSPIYHFAVGGPDAPSSVQWGHTLNQGRPFMNISRFALSQTDYLYDATDGRVGFRATG